MATSLTITRMRNLQKQVARLGLSHKHVRRDLQTYKMTAVDLLSIATDEFDLAETTKSRNRWEEYITRLVNAETTIQLHRALVECAGWLDMLDDWATNPPSLANDTM